MNEHDSDRPADTREPAATLLAPGGAASRVPVLLIPEAGGGFSVLAATLPGVASQGDTAAEAFHVTLNGHGPNPKLEQLQRRRAKERGERNAELGIGGER